MIALIDALSLYPNVVTRLPAERVRLDRALGRVLIEPVHARVDLPLFTQSAVDGYAVRSADTQRSPCELTLIGDVPAGSAAQLTISEGTAARILTGGALPSGADTVVRQEIVQRRDGTIGIRKGIPASTDIRFRGEEVKCGDMLAAPGERLRAGMCAALAMAGVTEVVVARVPRVIVLITGDEVVPLGQPLQPGQVHDANGPMIAGWFVERGYPAPTLRYVRDERALIARSLQTALEEADLVISTGGVSVGDRDYLPELAPTLGVKKVFWQVAQKPGKPLWFGVKEKCALLGLPGNPAAVLICLAVHVARVLTLLEGLMTPAPAWHSGLLDTPTVADAKRDRLVRMQRRYAEGRVWLAMLPRQESHMLSNLRTASVLTWLPARQTSYESGEIVQWLEL
jgi:molybdopterin molybdotransferase